ncbi:MAG: hypothetical protein MI723_00025, partial [Caulobacterales bacterium]|nr:hypothetical protein [Caulobacterales bacterium]
MIADEGSLLHHALDVERVAFARTDLFERIVPMHACGPPADRHLGDGEVAVRPGGVVETIVNPVRTGRCERRSGARDRAVDGGATAEPKDEVERTLIRGTARSPASRLSAPPGRTLATCPRIELTIVPHIQFFVIVVVTSMEC